jgi:hypothetical protein
MPGPARPKTRIPKDEPGLGHGTTSRTRKALPKKKERPAVSGKAFFFWVGSLAA